MRGRARMRAIAQGGPSLRVFARDSFNRADNSSSAGNADTGQAWVAGNGTFGIISNLLYCSVNSGGLNNAWIDAGTDADNVIIGADVTLAASSPGLIARVVDNANHYMCQFNTTSVFVYKRVASTYTQLATASGTYSSGSRLVWMLSGTNQTVWIAGLQQLSFSDATYGSGTKHGVFLQTVNDRVNDLLVTAVS